MTIGRRSCPIFIQLLRSAGQIEGASSDKSTCGLMKIDSPVWIRNRVAIALNYQDLVLVDITDEISELGEDLGQR